MRGKLYRMGVVVTLWVSYCITYSSFTVFQVRCFFSLNNGSYQLSGLMSVRTNKQFFVSYIL